jgi:WD40 repeat protein
MFRFDRVLIDPTADALGATLAEAAAAANKGFRVRNVNWTPDDTEDLLRGVAAAPEGFRQWNGPGERRQSGMTPRGETRSVLAVSWWTDPVRRPHYRIGSDRVYCAASDVLQNLLSPARQRPALWLTYPDDVYFRDQQGTNLFVICRCGMSGSPATLGWMGTHCAACHDRAEEGSAPALTSGDPARTRLLGHLAWSGRLLFTPDGGTLISADWSFDRILAWDLTSGTAREVAPDPGRQIHTLALAPDGQTLAVGFSRGTGPGEVGLFALKDDRWLGTFRANPADSRVMDLAFSPDGTQLAIFTSDQLHLSRVRPAFGATLLLDQGLGSGRSARYLAFSPNGGTLVSSVATPPGVRLWDLENGWSHDMQLEDVVPIGLSLTADGSILGVLALDSVCFLDCETGHQLARFPVHRPRELAFAPDGRIAAVAGEDEALWLYSVPTGQPIGVYYWHTGNLNAVAFSPDGRWLATSSHDCFIKLWPVPALLAMGSS